MTATVYFTKEITPQFLWKLSDLPGVALEGNVTIDGTCLRGVSYGL